MRNDSRADKRGWNEVGRQGRRTRSTQLRVPDRSDPALGAASLRQLVMAIEGGEAITARHRELAAWLRRHLDARVEALPGEIAALPPHLAGRLQHLDEAARTAAARGATIEDAVSHGLVTGGLLGDLERQVIRRLLSAIAADLEAVRAALVEAAMDAAVAGHDETD